jgi:hypothetical protein
MHCCWCSISSLQVVCARSDEILRLPHDDDDDDGDDDDDDDTPTAAGIVKGHDVAVRILTLAAVR